MRLVYDFFYILQCCVLMLKNEHTNNKRRDTKAFSNISHISLPASLRSIITYGSHCMYIRSSLIKISIYSNCLVKVQYILQFI